MPKKFVKTPKELVKFGQVLQVKVIEVDEFRNRISLLMVLE
ncbi:MAG: S1 RNA-binding domain-containing protein [Neisseriaceae bacterium]|nr:MAG: S1 RNA-binding domain-containing protein [Neisseriaceae bacterium]